ncbi:MAG: T6SS effector BTH_I2691 family protein [Pseudomonas sp.]
MHKPASEAELHRARRNQEFTNTPFDVAQCAFRQPQVSIFPVRYALDESPHSKASNQGPNPLPPNWQGQLPTLKTRSYTLRQLRDGWLYVWDSVEQTFHEYQVTGEHFTRHIWTQAQLNQDIRNNPGETHPYLLYSRNSQLRIAYSPVQITWRLCEHLRSSASAQQQWMRKLDLPAFCYSGKAEHGGWITELGNSVADILVEGEQAPSFTSTLLPTQQRETGAPYKPAFEEALVRGLVPEQDTSLFIALDDPLALVDDLSMNLAGRLMEQDQFSRLHQANLESALAVQHLCGFDTEAFIPERIKDPIQRQAYIDDLYTLLETFDQVERGKALVSFGQEGMVDLASARTVAAAQSAFKGQWGHLPDQQKWQQALEQWHDKRSWHEDVRFDDVLQYLRQTTVEAQQLQAHCQRSEADLLTWLNQLRPGGESVYHDTIDEQQASQLLETAHAVYTLLGNGEQGQRWLIEQAEQPSTLFGLALFNFNPEIASLIKTVTHNFSTYGTLDDQGREGDGSSPALTPGSAADATNLGSRLSELKGVLDLKAVRDSTLYQAMSTEAKHALRTLIKVANSQANEAWHGLSSMFLPAMKQQIGLTLAVTQVLISYEIASSIRLLINPNYPRDYQIWMLKVAALNKDIEGNRFTLRTARNAHDQRAARYALQALDGRMKTQVLMRPNQIIASASGTTRLKIGVTQINHWLTDLGQAEVMANMQTADRGQYLARTKAWMGQNLGTALPAVLVGLNAWNLWNTAKQASNDGQFTPEEWRVLSANAAYAGNAVAALWVGPAWNRAGGMVTELGKETLKVAKAGYSEWLRQAQTLASGSSQAAVAREFAAVSKGLILRTATWATLGAVAAGLEAWQIANEAARATSEEEHALLTGKERIVKGMAVISTGQLVGVGLGYWFNFAWVMSTPVTVALAILGIAYLLITMAANNYKREGLRLWLHRCSWGRGAKPEWMGNDGHPQQIRALLETLQRPTVVGRGLYYGGGHTMRRWKGFWIQVLVPATLSGKELTLQPAMVDKTYFCKAGLQLTPDNYYVQFLNGNWVNPRLLGHLPDDPRGATNNKDYIYTDTDEHRLWQAWIETSTAEPTFEMEVLYPADVLRRVDSRGYLFRLSLAGSAQEADRSNNAFSGELKEEDGVVLMKKSTQLLKLAIPH